MPYRSAHWRVAKLGDDNRRKFSSDCWWTGSLVRLAQGRQLGYRDAPDQGSNLGPAD
jgi:hypothetical protein